MIAMVTRFITKGRGNVRRVIPLRDGADSTKIYLRQKDTVAQDIARLKANKVKLADELASTKEHIIDVMKDSGHTIKLLELDLVQLKHDRSMVVVAKIKVGKDVVHHVVDDVMLKEKMLADDFSRIIESIKSKYHKTIEIWR